MIATGSTFWQKVALVIREVQDQRRGDGERGAAIIETALSMVILLTVIFAIMEISLAAYTFHFISSAAREGARYAMVRGSTAGTTACTSPGWATCIAQGGQDTGDIATYVKTRGFPGIDSSKMTVSSAWSAFAGGSTCPASPAPCNSPGNLVTVTVGYTFPLSIPFIPAATIPMTSTSAMIISQ